MNNLFKCSLSIIAAACIQGCSVLSQVSDSDYISPVQDVSLNIGESTIVHGAMEKCGREPRFWSDVTHLLPHSKIGYFSNGGGGIMNSKKCGGQTPVIAVKFTATKVGSESFNIFGDTINIVVGDNINFLQSNIPNPKKKFTTVQFERRRLTPP